MLKKLPFLWIFIILSAVALMPSSTQLVHAQDTAIEFPGEIMAIEGDVVIVGGIAVNINDAILPIDSLAVGMTVQIIGTRQDQTINATIVVITDYGDAIPEATQDTQPPTPVPSIVPTQDTQPPATEPPPVATEDTQPPVVDTDSPPIIVIEGPVQAISVNFITIFDIDIQVDASDPVLTQIRIGDTVRVVGESDFSNNTIVIVAVNITIVQTTIIIIQNPSPGVVYIPSLPPSCKRTKKGKVTCKQKSNKSRKSS